MKTESKKGKRKLVKELNIFNKKLQLFVSKKIVEYLNVQEDELVSFIIDHLCNKKSTENLTKKMIIVCCK
ncbi:hypothetical protein RhiirA1_481887 [Rhizophagus irregularis]|uniref:PWI domain-containing protein n=1 Tax=Rhizophagus irregularis TaxID=588596 RepID=A0A2N0QMJ0_9GLOM|nr:hypothetical protein RhiirA1_481887 [Rhizophagus irregularis]